MWTKKARFIISPLLLAFCLFVPCVGICSENQTYTISESELTTLENHLNELTTNTETLKTILTAQDGELTQALNLLMKSQSELLTLKTQLQQAKNDAESARKSLATANAELKKAALYFKEYEAERDKTENRLRNQRNIWEVLCLVAVGVAVAR
jgi:Skp family chaperone for outer membrane proteins